MQSMKTVSINNRLSGYMIKSDKFKTDLIGVYIKRQLNKEEASLNALLSRILIRATKTYQTTKSLNTYLESCYGMILVSDVVKYGDHHILQVKLQFPDPKHILDKDIFDNAIDLVKEILFNPLIENGGFKQSYFEQEKAHLIDEIEGRINDKMSYSLERCIEYMYEGENYANYVYGDVEGIEKITNEDLYLHYKKIIDSSKVDISIMGDIDYDVVESKLRSLPIEAGPVVVSLNDRHKTDDLKVIHEELNVKQGKLVLGYNTPYSFSHPLYEASILAFHILGGGPNSKLFKLLREEHGLCYYVYTKSDKFKGNVFVGAGIESENYDHVVALIGSCLENLTITADDLIHAKDAMIASVRSILDFPNSFINFFYTEMLDRDLSKKFSLDDMVDRFEDVDLEDVMSIYKQMTLDTIYFINGGSQ
ncbi:insulinase family protein [Acidaminobacter sp. JC074]|uniref:EF-P 5-aminopentanol modification-associated protein YfmF n=1 Tax=Acidaminobacter sp. JC074 TaxID=2530199 RepID=UPI001F0FC931|nr:pitrilysin family protein [Acidaminobacter sp. JC074]MCH4890210.1 insulinase family protein [Acidaminobacter sp. JC074]